MNEYWVCHEDGRKVIEVANNSWQAREKAKKRPDFSEETITDVIFKEKIPEHINIENIRRGLEKVREIFKDA